MTLSDTSEARASVKSFKNISISLYIYIYIYIYRSLRREVAVKPRGDTYLVNLRAAGAAAGDERFS